MKPLISPKIPASPRKPRFPQAGFSLFCAVDGTPLSNVGMSDFGIRRDWIATCCLERAICKFLKNHARNKNQNAQPNAGRWSLARGNGDHRQTQYRQYTIPKQRRPQFLLFASSNPSSMEKRGEIICSRNYRLPYLNRNRRQARPTAASTRGYAVLPTFGNFAKRQAVAPCAGFADSHE
jgi:hypothetical protein